MDQISVTRGSKLTTLNKLGIDSKTESLLVRNSAKNMLFTACATFLYACV